MSEFVVTAGKREQEVSVVRNPTSDTAVRIAEDAGDALVQYIGKAPIGSLTSAAVWQIKKLDENSGTVITYADGDVQFNNVWDNRESLSYS